MSTQQIPVGDVVVLDAQGAADLLQVSTKTILKLARSGELPGKKIGREWRFVRTVLIDYVAGPAST